MVGPLVGSNDLSDSDQSFLLGQDPAMIQFLLSWMIPSLHEDGNWRVRSFLLIVSTMQEAIHVPSSRGL